MRPRRRQQRSEGGGRRGVGHHFSLWGGGRPAAVVVVVRAIVTSFRTAKADGWMDESHLVFLVPGRERERDRQSEVAPQKKLFLSASPLRARRDRHKIMRSGAFFL